MKIITIIFMSLLILIIGCANVQNNEEGDTMNSVAVFDTSLGKFKIELFEDKSPITAGNFKKLVDEGFYDGTRFHRVIKKFMNQGGDPLSKDLSQVARWGTGSPGYTIEDEFVEGLSNVPGTISMANSGPNSGGSQFFINVVDNSFLDWNKPPASSKHPVFGKVVEGMDVVMTINNVETVPGDRPQEDVLINKITIE
ncbi:peptidylprolyl isomerase [Candidatus Woesearchaeota archaeon]|nr:peptidylprolyl isomerase [Candidatus Woesearchaeota archaeon]